MGWISAVWLRLKALVKRPQLDRDLQDELAFHLAMREQKYRAEGMSASAAHAAARRAFGNVTALQETTRSLWIFPSLETFGHDLRYAVRMLTKTPGLTTVIVLSLALGIGANTAIFSVVNAMMLRLLPVQEPGSLMLLTSSAKGWPGKVLDDLEGSTRKDPNTGLTTTYSFSLSTFEYLRAHGDVFSSMLAFTANTERVNVGLQGRADDAELQAVSGDFFSTLGVPAHLGRMLVPSDDTGAASPAAVVSYGFWQRKMGGDASAVGRSIVVNGTAVTVAGIAPPEFFGIAPGSSPDIYVPLTLYAAETLRNGNFDLRPPKVWWLGIIGRLQPGVTQAQAQARLEVLFKESLAAVSSAALQDSDMPSLGVERADRGLDGLRHQFSSSLKLLMAMVGLVLLIACANVAGLLLARATVRQKEIAVRLSLGAARSRVIRQLLTESVLLALLGGATGLLIARWARAALSALLASGRQPIYLSIESDARVLAFTAAVSILCGIVFGLAPALRATRMELFPALKQAAGNTPARHRFLSGKILVGAQVALSLLLIIGAGLLIGTLQRLQNLDLGFQRDNLVTFRVQPGLNGYKGERLVNYYDELRRRLGLIPAVRSVAFAQMGPVASGISSTSAVIPGYTAPGKQADVARHWVGNGYFDTLGIPVVLGRALGPQDVETSPKVVVVNQKVVRDYFHHDNPIGRRMVMSSSEAKGVEIVGVVADVKYNSLRDDAPPAVYFPHRQRAVRGAPQYLNFMTFLVRTAGDPQSVMADVQRQALELDAAVPVVNLRTEVDLINRSLFLERTFAILSSSFGFLALLLACVGLYGTISYTVAQRTNEIGIRMALGAGRETILGMILRDTLRVVTVGIAVGLPLAWAGTRLLQAQLYGLSPHDARTIFIATLAILGVTLTAGFLPARRAARVDPMIALRQE